VQRIAVWALLWTFTFLRTTSPLWCLLIFIPFSAFAQDVRQDTELLDNGSPFYLEADHLNVDGRNWMLNATGNVTLSREDVCLEADEIDVDLKRERSSALGDVHLVRGGDVLHCNELEYQWAYQTGWIRNGTLHIGETGYTITGDFLEKTGPDTYFLEQGSFTTCDCPGPSRVPWRIGAKRSEVTLGGYARVEDATVYIYEIPALYLPIGYVPVRLHRETGFLVPSVGFSSTNGLEMELPFYWAINASMDATLYSAGLTKRGFKPTLEFRYTPSKKTSGEMRVSGIQDAKVDSFRYGVQARHKQQISSSVYDKLDLNLVSDNDYIVDFSGELGHPSDRFVESRGIVGVKKDNLHAAAQFALFDFMAGAGGMRVPQSAPRLDMDFLRSPLLSQFLSLRFGSSFVNFVNEEGSERTRMDLFPRMFFSLPGIRDLGVEGEFGFRETVDWEDWEGVVSEGTQHREICRAAAGTEFPIWKQFQWGSYRLSHILRPGLQYQYVEQVSGDDLSVFDGIDAYPNRNILTYSVSNSIIGGALHGEKGALSGTFVECSVKQSVDVRRLRDHKAKEYLSDILVLLTVSPREYVSLRMDLGLDPNGGQIRSVHGGARVANRTGRYQLQLGYVSVRSHTIDSISKVELLDDYDRSYHFPGIGNTLQGTVRARIFDRLKGSLRTVYQLEESGKVENRVECEYLSKCRCWSALMTLRQTVRPEDISFSIRFQFEGLGSYF